MVVGFGVGGCSRLRVMVTSLVVSRWLGGVGGLVGWEGGLALCWVSQDMKKRRTVVAGFASHEIFYFCFFIKVLFENVRTSL